MKKVLCMSLASLVRDEAVMRSSVSPLLACAAVGGGQMRARAVCTHGAFKLAARLLTKYEERRDKEAAIDVSHCTVW